MILVRYEVNERIRRVAEVIDDNKEFKKRAEEAAKELGPNSIQLLSELFHSETNPPKHLQDKFPGLGDWLSARQHAIFEILYHFREASLPLLRKVAFGKYDWIQINAIDILCRFASEGIETKKIEEEIANHILQWDYRAVLGSLPFLIQFAAHAPEVRDTIHELISLWSEEDPIESLEILEPLANYLPKEAQKYEKLLRNIVQQGKGIRSPLADGQVVRGTLDEDEEDQEILIALDGPIHPSIQDYHAIRAAFILHQLFPTDKETLSLLQKLAIEHPDERVRAEIQKRLANKE